MTTRRFTAPVRLTAAAGNKPRRLSIFAYSGDVMFVSGFGPTCIDLAGLGIPTTLPILADHQNELGAMVGTGTAATDGKTLTVSATAADNATGREVVALLADGHSLQASVGAEVLQERFIAAGETVTVNGRTITADAHGFALVSRSVLREVSIVAIGADGSTHVSIAAKAASRGSAMYEKVMLKAAKAAGNIKAAKFTEAEIDAMTEDEAKAALKAVMLGTEPPAEPLDASWAGAEILAQHCPKLIAQAGREKWSLERCKTEALKAAYADMDYRHLRDSLPNGVRAGNPHGGGNGAMTSSHLAAAIMVRAGHSAAAEKAFGANVMEQSRRLHAAALPDICAHALRIDGKEVPSDRGRMVRAALSTGTMPVALGDSANKILEHSYRAAPATWRSWCAVRPAANFKEQSSVRPSFVGDLEEVSDGGQVKHGTYEESVIEWSIAQFAKKLSIGRKSIVSDDLGAFTEVLPALGKAAQRTLASLIYTTLLANAGSHFASGNNNYASGGGSALSATSLAVALRKLRVQADDEGNILDLMPAVLLVPPELEITARALLNSAELSRITSTDALPTGNSFQNLATLEVEPRLSSAAYAGYSATGWYLFASPADVPMIVGFLDGRESPTLETFGFDSDSNTLEMSWRAVFDFGAALGDHRAAVFSAGA